MASSKSGKLRVGVLFGGRSGEHEVSLLSAASILNAIDREKYEVIPIGISKDGTWLVAQDAERLLNGAPAASTKLRAGDPAATSSAAILGQGESVIIPPVPGVGESTSLVPFQQAGSPHRNRIDLDVIFPVLHGTFGEDGTIQGLFELADIAYVGAGVLGSAAGMDKDVMKRLFAAAKLPIVKHSTILRSLWEKAPRKVIKQIEEGLRYPVFVKPANLGSSVGITKAHDSKELKLALDEAARYDRKLIVEEGVGGKKNKAREIEVSVLGNDDPKVSVAGEIVPVKEFYDYEAKYIDAGSELIIPAKLTQIERKTIEKYAKSAFLATNCEGLARIDFLMDPKTRKIYVNEINTMPGFTSISMYPKLWAASGIPYPELINRLIQLGLERHAEKRRNRYSKD